MAGRTRYDLLVVNQAGTSVLTDPIGEADPETNRPGHTKIDLSPRHLEAGFGEFTTAATPDLMDALYQPDARLLARRWPDDGNAPVEIVMNGPVEVPEQGFQIERDGPDKLGTVSVKFTDDKVWLGYRQVYPNPAQPATGQITTARYTITAVNPETAMYALANLNAGPGALTARRIPGLTMASPAGLKPGVTVSTSFTRDTVLSDALREVSRLAGGAGLGYRVEVGADGLGMRFEVFEPEDLTSEVVFSRALGNIRELTYSQSAPTATVAIVGDATAGVNRVVKERINTGAHAAGWVRREVFVDARGAANAAELDQAGDEALAEQGPQTVFAFKAIETPTCRIFYDYGIGSLVSGQPYIGGPFVTATCLGADITVTPDRGEQVVPIIGNSTDVLGNATAAEIRKLWRTVRRMQGAL